MGQGTDAKILSLTALGGPRLAHSKNWPHPLRFLKNLGKTFLGVVRPGGPGAKIYGAALKCVGALTSGPRGVQNKTGSEPLTQSVLAQWPREKVKILKFRVLRAFWGRCSPRTMTHRRDVVPDSDTTANVIGGYEKSRV